MREDARASLFDMTQGALVDGTATATVTVRLRDVHWEYEAGHPEWLEMTSLRMASHPLWLDWMS